MGTYIREPLLCLLALAVLVRGGVVTTQDTIVVARTDDAPTPVPPQNSEVTTEEPSPPIKLTDMEVTSDITMRYAHTAVVTKVKNPAKKAQEATFRVLLPETAFISGFTMILDGKPYKAYIKEKEEAKDIYNQAVSQGIGAAHIAAKARDSNHFTVSVNVEPNSVAVFNLTYEEFLQRRRNVYNHAINLHPGSLVPKLTVTVNIKETEKITELRVPEVRTGNEIDATDKDKQNDKAAITKNHDDREVTITFKPDLEEQKRLMEVYAEKSKQSQYESEWHDYSSNVEKKQEGILGQFVVQYDVDHKKDGEILVNDGYFVHFFAPTEDENGPIQPLNKHVVFVLDVSGSMMGRKIQQLQEAMRVILVELNKGDYFSIVAFASSVKVEDLSSAELPTPPKATSFGYGGLYSESTDLPELLPPAPATPENIEKAKTIVSRLVASGGTNIADALNVAVDLVHKGVGWKRPPPNNTSTDHPVALPANQTPKEVEEKEVEEDGKNDTPKQGKAAKVEEKKDVSEAKRLEPIIIFLTDGDPTVGETNTKRIITRLSEKNFGDNKASIFSLAFGEDADRSFLRKLSLHNEGFMRHIYEAADAALQLQDFYKQVSSPLLSDVRFTYPKDQIKEGSLTKNKFKTYYEGSEVVVAGRLDDAAKELTPTVVAGWCEGPTKKKYEIFPKVPVARPRNSYLPLERMWAYLTVKQLLDEKDAAEDIDESKNKTEDLKKKALDIALKYEFVTPLTSLVVVKPNATKAVDAESVDKIDTSEDLPIPVAGFRPGYQAFGGALPMSYIATRPSMLQATAYRSTISSAMLLQDNHENFEVQEEPDYFDAYYMSPGRPQVSSALMHGVHASFSQFAAVAPGLPGPPPPLYDAILTTPVNVPQAPTSTTRRPQVPGNILLQYNMDGYRWAEPLINVTADQLVMDINGTAVFLKLSRGAEPPKAATGDADCPLASDLNGPGSCVYLTRCKISPVTTLTVYRQTYCTVDGFAGICCPKTAVKRQYN